MKVELRVNHWVFFNQGYIEPVGEGVLVQLHNPNLIAVYPGKWPPHLKYSTYVPKKATRRSYQNLNAFWFGHFTRTLLISRFFKSQN